MRAYEHELAWSELTERFLQLDEACRAFDFDKVLGILRLMVQEYVPAIQGDDHLLWREMAKHASHNAAIH